MPRGVSWRWYLIPSRPPLRGGPGDLGQVDRLAPVAAPAHRVAEELGGLHGALHRLREDLERGDVEVALDPALVEHLDLLPGPLREARHHDLRARVEALHDVVRGAQQQRVGARVAVRPLLRRVPVGGQVRLVPDLPLAQRPLRQLRVLASRTCRPGRSARPAPRGRSRSPSDLFGRRGEAAAVRARPARRVEHDREHRRCSGARRGARRASVRSKSNALPRPSGLRVGPVEDRAHRLHPGRGHQVPLGVLHVARAPARCRGRTSRRRSPAAPSAAAAASGAATSSAASAATTAVERRTVRRW